MTIGEKIKMQRKSLGLTQTELGAKLGVQKNAVSKWECGRVDDIPSSKIKVMAQLFGVQPSYLIDDEITGLPSPAITKSLIHNLPTAPQLLPDEQQLLSDYRNFNDEGQEKVRDYVEDLKDSPKYKKCSAPCMEKQA